MKPSSLKPPNPSLLRSSKKAQPKKDLFSSVMSKVVKQESSSLETSQKEALIDGPVFSPLLPPPTPELSTDQTILLTEKNLSPLMEPLVSPIEVMSTDRSTQLKMVLHTSTFGDVHVVIDQYDTAPFSFHLSFYGTEELQKQVTLQNSSLLGTLQKLLPRLSFSISPPFYPPISQPLSSVERKERRKRASPRLVKKMEQP